MNAQIAVIKKPETAKILSIGLWAVQLGVAYMFFTAGWSKLAGNPQMIGLFDVIGMGQWFRYLTGFLEILGGALVLVPALATLGGLLLSGVMVGAVATHLFIIGGSPTMALLLLASSALIAVGRYKNSALKI